MMHAPDYDETLPAWPFHGKKGGAFLDPRWGSSPAVASKESGTTSANTPS
jgi:hypothetical protein